MATLSRCHIALGPIPDPVIYKEAALSLAKSHSQVLASSVALLDCADTPGASTSVYSNKFCQILVDLLPPGVKRENPLLRDSSLSTPQSNISRYATFSYWIKSWLTLLPYEIDFQHRLQMNLSLPPTQPSDDLTQGPTLGVVSVMNSDRDNRSPDAMTSQAK